MNKILLTALLGILTLTGFSHVENNNFEGGNWLYYYNLCWGIGPNSSYFGSKVTANTNQGFNGSFVCETDNLGQTAVCRLESPWMDMAPGDITFDHAIPSFDGTRKIKVFAVQYGTNLETQLGSTITYTNSTPISTTIPANLTGNYKIRWQWEGSGGNSRGQLDNIQIPGTNVSNPSNNCAPINPPSPDIDGDGVPNTDDEYPNDASRAYNNYYPASDTGTLAYEDRWPYTGDYDLNDLVLGYKFKVVTNAESNVVEIFNTLILRANGANYSNGFGYQLPDVSPESILSVTGAGNQTGYSIGANGTETGNPEKATIIVFDKSHRYLPEWNTDKNAAHMADVRFTLHLVFMNNGVAGPAGAVSLNGLNIADWNPFLVVNGKRGKEVHLPDHLPTSLADVSLLGEGNDDSQPGSGKYYKSKTNLPWALDIHGQFDYPAETQDVNEAYHHFGQWVVNGGTQFPDWWSNTSSGYRENAKIY
jgi:LruC domain-containing protein